MVVIPSNQVINSNEELAKFVIKKQIEVVIPSNQVINSNRINVSLQKGDVAYVVIPSNQVINSNSPYFYILIFSKLQCHFLGRGVSDFPIF